MILFVIGLLLGKWITGSWVAGFFIGIVCSIFLGDEDPDDDSPRGRR